jgi:hypothetical protein
MVLERPHSFQNPPGKPVIQTEVFRGFTQSLQKNTEKILRVGHNNFIRNPFQFIDDPKIRRYLV